MFQLLQVCMYFCFITFHIKGVATRFLDDASSDDINAFRIRLTEEKLKRLLLQNDVEMLMVKVEALERKLKDNEPRKHALTPVHFNVKLTSHTDVNALHVIAFNKIIENVGEGYSANTGIFRAMYSGLYQFSLSILSRAKGQYAHIQLMKNDQEIGRTFAGSDVSNWVQSSSCTVTTHLSEGDEVYAREIPGLTGHLHGQDYCSFSGVLLQTDE